MYRLFLTWTPLLRRNWYRIALLVVVVAVLVGFPLLASLPSLPFVALAAALVAVLVLRFRLWWLQLFRFGWRTCHFRTHAAKGFSLRYAPALDESPDLVYYIDCCERALSDLTERFGFPLRRPLVVYLFASHADMGQVFASGAQGMALCPGDAILLAARPVFTTTLEELVRHELAHVFSSHWGPLDPPLKGEGLATWLMETVEGRPIDFEALAAFLGEVCPLLPRLLHRSYFRGAAQRDYTAAGSFTGYLIRRFGWDVYRRFFSRCRAENFAATFSDTFGESFLSVERQWRDDLFARRQTFEPELSRAVGDRRVAAAYEAGHYYRCLEETEALHQAGQAGPRVLWFAAAAQSVLGNYDAAASLMDQALRSPDAWVRAYAGAAHLMLGRLNDLRGRREVAVAAYERVLAAPDYADSDGGSMHAEARRYLRRAFTEDDLIKKLSSPPGQRNGR